MARTLLLLLSAGAVSTEALFRLSADYTGPKFFDQFEFEILEDPTHGWVRYVDQQTAFATDLANLTAADGTIYLGVDSSTQLASEEKRNSTRVISKAALNVPSLLVADILHQPGGACGTWPAFWLLGSAPWPQGGEIDIIEGVNDQAVNKQTLHTSPGFQISGAANLSSGEVVSLDCDVQSISQAPNQGCQISGGPYGKSFNDNQGGIYAVDISSEAIRIWYFQRGHFPSNLMEVGTLDTIKGPSLQWGLPVAHFLPTPGSSILNHFTQLHMIFNIDFCGDWAGAEWTENKACSNLAPSCQSYVANNPSAFRDAYWRIGDLRVYKKDSVERVATYPSTTIPSPTTLGEPSLKPATPSSIHANPADAAADLDCSGEYLL